MESTINDSSQAARADARVRKTGAGDAVPELHGQEVPNLSADVQSLLGRVAHVADPEIARLRVRIERGLSTAKKTIADGTDRVQRQAKVILTTGDGYVRDRPWQAVGVAAVVGLFLGFLVARRSSRP
jgi:ElaB protein